MEAGTKVSVVERRRGIDVAVCLVLVIVALAAYLRTMRPTFGWGDSSELITAAYFLGVGHAPGYPTWMLLAYPFSHLPIGDVAFRVNFMTALFGAIAVALLYLLYIRICGSRPAAFIAALTFAFSATFWDQTTEAEVYTLHVCLATTILLIVLAWRSHQNERTADHRLFLLAWVIGISLGNHALTMLMIPAILCFIWAEKGLRFFTRRRVLTCAAFFLLGLSIYVYEPIRALDNPPPHLNNPHNLIEMWAQLTAPGARHAMFDRGLLVPLQRVIMYLYRLGAEFQLAGCALALFGLGLLWRKDRRLTVLLSLIALFDIAYSVNFSIFDIYVYFLPLHLVWAAFLAVGAKGTLDLAQRLMTKVPERFVSPSPVWRYGPAVALLMALPMMQFTTHFNLVDGSQDYGSERFARAVVKQVEPGALILADWWAIAPIGYLKYIEGQRQDLVMFAAPSLHTESGFLNFAQEDFLRSYPSVYFVEMLTYRMQLMRNKCYLVPQGPLYRVYVDRPAPEEVLADLPAVPIARFGDQVGLVKAELGKQPVQPGECFDFTLYWTPLETYKARNYEAILVLENKKDGRIWQESNLLGHNLYPLDKWRKNEVLKEEHRIYLPDPEPKGEYNLYLRVREHGQSKCLTCTKHERGGQDRDYLLARLQVGDPSTLPAQDRVPKVMAFLRP